MKQWVGPPLFISTSKVYKRCLHVITSAGPQLGNKIEKDGSFRQRRWHILPYRLTLSVPKTTPNLVEYMHSGSSTGFLPCGSYNRGEGCKERERGSDSIFCFSFLRRSRSGVGSWTWGRQCGCPRGRQDPVSQLSSPPRPLSSEVERVIPGVGTRVSGVWRGDRRIRGRRHRLGR